jgi:hypothetical protein
MQLTHAHQQDSVKCHEKFCRNLFFIVDLEQKFMKRQFVLIPVDMHKGGIIIFTRSEGGGVDKDIFKRIGAGKHF